MSEPPGRIRNRELLLTRCRRRNCTPRFRPIQFCASRASALRRSKPPASVRDGRQRSGWSRPWPAVRRGNGASAYGSGSGPPPLGNGAGRHRRQIHRAAPFADLPPIRRGTVRTGCPETGSIHCHGRKKDAQAESVRPRSMSNDALTIDFLGAVIQGLNPQKKVLYCYDCEPFQ